MQKADQKFLYLIIISLLFFLLKLHSTADHKVKDKIAAKAQGKFHLNFFLSSFSSSQKKMSTIFFFIVEEMTFSRH